MRKAKRPVYRPARKRAGPPAGAAAGGAPQPRRRTPLEHLPPGAEPPFELLGSPDRAYLLQQAEPLEQVVLQGYTREIEAAYQEHNGRFDDFWLKHPELVEKARKMEGILRGIRDREE